MVKFGRATQYLLTGINIFAAKINCNNEKDSG
jgi:hypothetical protein